MPNDESLSETISFLRFPLTLGVVFIHFNIAEGFNIHGVAYGLGNPEWYYYIISFFSNVLPRIAVPLFFFISGFLFFYHTDFDKATYKHKLKSRIKTLLIPYILWNIIALICQGIKLLPCLAWMFPNANKIGIDFSLSAILNSFWDLQRSIFIFSTENVTPNADVCPIDVPLWYVRDLMIMVACAPILYWLIRKSGYYFIIVLGLAWYILQPFDLRHLFQLTVASFFFSWGAFYSINRMNFVTVFRKYSIASLLYVPVAMADVLTKGEDYNHYIHMAGILVGIVAVVSITSHLFEKGKIKVNSFLSNSSFFIFALHFIILGDVGKILFKLMYHSDSPYFWIFFYFFVPIFTTCLCLGLYKILRKYFPKIAGVLTGGR